jgi:hypothetical protein
LTPTPRIAEQEEVSQNHGMAHPNLVSDSLSQFPAGNFPSAAIDRFIVTDRTLREIRAIKYFIGFF